MATIPKLNNNLLLLSSKSTHNIRSSVCHFKSLQCGANSKVSGLKVERFRLNSTSGSRINNNVALSFYSDEAETFYPNSLSCSTNTKNVTYQFEVVKRALTMLKSKVPSLVMASCLMLGMMIINYHKPAFARTPFSSSSPAAAASSSSARGCLLCSDGCIFCLKMPASSDKLAKESRYRHSGPPSRDRRSGPPAIYSLILWFEAAACVVLTMIALIIVLDGSNLISIFKIQVGLLVGKDLQRDLSLIAETLENCTSSCWTTILDDTIKIFNLHCNNWRFGYSYGNILGHKDGNALFRRLKYEEQKKFDKERPLNLRNVNAESLSTSCTHDVVKLKNTYMVVTLLVTFRGRHKLPTIRKSGDLDRALKKLKLYYSKSEPEGLDVFWAPQKGNEIMSRQQLEKNYPLLKPFNTTNNSSMFNKFINRIFNL